MPTDQNEIKEQLLTLAENSPALKTLSEEARTERMDAMMGSTIEQMLQLIKIFEEENIRVKNIDEDYEGSVQKINQFISETSAEKKSNDRKEIIEKENTVRADDDKYAEDLIKKLDEIV